MRKLWLLMVCLLLCLTGCGEKPPTETTVALQKDGSVVHTLIGSWDPVDDDLKELKTDIGTYITDFGQDRISLNDASAAEDQVTIVMTYASAQDYADFNGVFAFCGTLTEARASGYINGGFTDRKGETYDLSKLYESGDRYHCLILNEPVAVQVPGKIICVSAGLADVTGRKTAVIREEEEKTAVSASSETAELSGSASASLPETASEAETSEVSPAASETDGTEESAVEDTAVDEEEIADDDDAVTVDDDAGDDAETASSASAVSEASQVDPEEEKARALQEELAAQLQEEKADARSGYFTELLSERVCIIYK